MIVYSRCHALREEFGDATEVQLDLSKDALYKIMEYMYTDYTYMEPESDVAKEVLEFSSKYKLTKLAHMCGVHTGILQTIFGVS